MGLKGQCWEKKNCQIPLALTCKYSLSVKFSCGHQAEEDDKAASAGEYCGESCEDAVTVLLAKNGDEESIIKIKSH